MLLFPEQKWFMVNLFQLAHQALISNNIADKIKKTNSLHQYISTNSVDFSPSKTIKNIDDPGRPDQPSLTRFAKVPKRSNTDQGLIHTVHAITHIEFNAINIALDALYRFQDMPKQYYLDWANVAKEESEHFLLLNNFLSTLGHQYGDFCAHNGLWQMCINTQDSALNRMALVPRVLEARGLDATPAILEKFKKSQENPKNLLDFAPMIAILNKIFDDEIGHVLIGNNWFNYLCKQQNLDPITIFDQLIKQHIGNKLHGEFNLEARKQAGFTDSELKYLTS